MEVWLETTRAKQPGKQDTLVQELRNHLCILPY